MASLHSVLSLCIIQRRRKGWGEIRGEIERTKEVDEPGNERKRRQRAIDREKECMHVGGRGRKMYCVSPSCIFQLWFFCVLMQNALNFKWNIKRVDFEERIRREGGLKPWHSTDRPKPSERNVTQIIVISGTVIIVTSLISTIIHFIIMISTTYRNRLMVWVSQRANNSQSS